MTPPSVTTVKTPTGKPEESNNNKPKKLRQKSWISIIGIIIIRLVGWGRGVDRQALADFRGDTLGTFRRHLGNIRATDGEGCGDSWGASFGRGATDGEVWCDSLGTLGVFVRKSLTKQRFSRGFCGALADQRRTSVGRWRCFSDAAICLTVSALAALGDKRGGFAVTPCAPITTNRENDKNKKRRQKG